MAVYVPLWCKTNYSFLEGASSPAEMLETASALELPALAVTDSKGMYGIVRAYCAAKETQTKLIVGSQISIDGCGTLVLLCRNRQGYENLCTMLSAAHMRAPKGEAAFQIEEVCSGAEGLTVLWIHECERTLPKTQIRATLEKLKAAFGTRVYAGISRHGRLKDTRTEAEALELARSLAILPVAVNEVVYHRPERRKLQDVLTCIREGRTLREAGTLLRENDSHALLSNREFLYLFRDAPEMVERTLEIAEECKFSLSELEYRYPNEAVPEGFTTASWLRQLTMDGAKQRYGGRIAQKVLQQLLKELAVIEQLRYSGYFLTMWEIVQYCRRNSILCQGRGSAANSAVCFCLGITAIDPVQMDLLFERFLSLERAEPPDIDLDIEHNRREEVIQHMYSRYGRDRAAMVANVVRYRPRSAVRDVGKTFGVPEVVLDRCAKLLPYWGHDLTPALLEAGLDLPASVLNHLSARVNEILGFPRHLSIHPGGFLLGSGPVTSLVPVENATMPNRTIIQWDKEDVEALKLFKVDLLGLGALTHLDHSFRLLQDHYAINLDLAAIPHSDRETYKMLRRADTVGVFQLESRAQMAMLPRLKPRDYYDLVIEVSLVRPGPISGGMVHPYLRRRAKLEPVDYPHPDLEPVLGKTLGVPLFQEQVMKLAVVAGDYSPGEADQLRRDMAAWRYTGRIESHKERLVSRMVAKGIAQEFAERTFAQIQGFGEYGFPESHAASFALIAYATAYIKCHYPEVFACALLNAWPMGFYSPSTIIEDAKRHGVEVRPMDVLRSQWNCTLEPIEQCSSGLPGSPGSIGLPNTPGSPSPGAMPPGQPRYAIRIGMRFLKGFSRSDWEKIAKQLEKTMPANLEEFKKLCRVPRDVFEKLSLAGALESYGLGRRTSLWSVLDRVDLGEGGGNAGRGEAEVLELVAYEEGRALFRRPSEGETIAWDYETGEHSARGHVLAPYRAKIQARGLPDALQLACLDDGETVSYAGYAICRQMPGTAQGVLFMTLEDETGFVNLVVWQKVYSEYRTLILTNWFLGVTGTLQAKEGVVHLIAESFWVPDLKIDTATEPAGSRNFH